MGIASVREHFAGHLQAVERSGEALAEPIEECSHRLGRPCATGKRCWSWGMAGRPPMPSIWRRNWSAASLQERRALPAIALTTDSSILTAVGNDYGFDQVFKRQVEALAVPGDVVIGISTSGNSPNVSPPCRRRGRSAARRSVCLAATVASIAALVDINLTVPAMQTPHIQEVHAIIVHILCRQVEQQLFCRNAKLAYIAGGEPS